MGKYTEAYNEFTAKYELGFNIKAEYDAAKKFAVIDDFTMDTSPAMKAQNIYISALSSALTAHLNGRVKIGEGKDYDITNFDLNNFITEFDKVMDAIRSDEAEEAKTKGVLHSASEYHPRNT